MSDRALKISFDAETLNKIQARLGCQLDDPRAAEHLNIPRVSFGRFLLELLLSLKREKLVVTFQPPAPPA